MSKKVIKAARSEAFGLFKEHEADWFFRRVLEPMSVGGAEIGECLSAARKIDERDGASWVREWAGLAQRLHNDADKAFQAGHLTSARELYLRASNYYAAAEYCAGPEHDLFDLFWQKGTACFEKAGALFKIPLQKVFVPYQGKELPGYFWRAKEGENCPTLIVAGGNDSSMAEVFFSVAFAAVNRGYNFFAFEHPGHRGAVHLYKDCVKICDYEQPYSNAIDLLQTLPGVDERIALTGFSFGGYVASRVAIYDKRIKAVIPNSPLVDMMQIGGQFWSGLMKMIKKMPVKKIKAKTDKKLKHKPLVKVLKDYTTWTNGHDHIGDMDISYGEAWQIVADFWEEFDIKGEIKNIDCPALALVGAGEGEESMRQAKLFIDGIASQNKQLYVFSLEKDGSDDHCQLDNRTRGNQIMFDWLDEVFCHNITKELARFDV